MNKDNPEPVNVYNVSIAVRETINETQTMSICTFFVCYAIKRRSKQRNIACPKYCDDE